MKIAVLADYIISADIEKHLAGRLAQARGRSTPTGTVNLSRGLARIRGVELHHIFPSPSVSEDTVIETDNVTVHLLRVPRRVTSLSLLQYPKRRINQLLAELKPDVVHGHHAETGYPYYAISSGYPAVAGIHNYVPNLIRLDRKRVLSTMVLYSLFEEYTFRRARYITVDSIFMEKFIRSRTRAKVYRIPNCVHELFFAKPDPGSESEHPSLVCVGALRQEKGLDTLLEAMPLIKSAFPEVKLKIIGSLTIELKQIVDRMISQMGLAGSVDLLGWKDWQEIASELSKSWVAVVPSLYEPFGCTVVEAQAMGKPVVGSNVGGIAENIVDGESGLLFEAGNAEELADRVKMLLSKKEDRTRLGHAAASRAQTLFHPDIVAERHLSIYREILSGRA